MAFMALGDGAAAFIAFGIVKGGAAKSACKMFALTWAQIVTGGRVHEFTTTLTPTLRHPSHEELVYACVCIEVE